MTVNHIDLTIESDRYLKEMPAFENSPAIYGWVMRPTRLEMVPSGTKENALIQFLPDALRVFHHGTSPVAHAGYP